jgi:hypothetical protein
MSKSADLETYQKSIKNLIQLFLEISSKVLIFERK